MIPVWMLLGFAIWTLLVLLAGVGVYRWSLILTGRAQITGFPADEPHGPPFYRRVMRAHANCLENLPVFGAIVFAAYATGASSPLIDTLSIAVLVARVLQSLTHISSGGNVATAIRFVFFAAQIGAFFALAWLIVSG